MSVLQTGFGNSGGDYTISRSVRLRSSASAYFNRTPASAGNRKTWTWSGWVKRGSLGSYQYLLHCGTTSATGNYGDFGFDNSDKFYLGVWAGAVVITNRVFRDPSAWYHIVVAVDTTQATSSNRFKLYVNGVQETSFSTDTISTYYTLNYDTAFNQALQHSISSRQPYTSDGYFDGYLTEINFIDGQALTPSSFGETDTITGVWKPKKYTGTYGTNGFYLNFSDNSNNTAATIGKDYSGNGNNWTPNNISVTSGVTYDSMLDVPTMYADGGNGRGNYAVMNPLDKYLSDGSITNANLTLNGASNWNACRSNWGMSSGKWYWETVHSSYNQSYQGIADKDWPPSTYYVGYSSTGYSASFGNSGLKYVDGASGASYGSSFGIGDVIGYALDMDAGTLTCYINGTSQGTMVTGLTAYGTIFPAFSAANGAVINANFGQRPFANTPPTGFLALNTQNLPEGTIKKGNAYFDVSTWSGDQTTPRSITNTAGFQPDFVWLKSRSNAYQHNIYDAVRGAGAAYSLSSDQTAAEGGNSSTYGYLSAFNSNGFAVAQGSGGSGGAPNGYAYVNQTSSTYTAWQWKAGGSAVSNTSGSITSSVSANPSAGFSVVTYTGNGTAGATIGHGLGVAPSMVIVKQRNASTIWVVGHTSLTWNSYLRLNETTEIETSVLAWNNTSPTSTVVSLGSSSGMNGNTNTYVAYCFSAVAGYSKFGSYTGNSNADGPFVYCGFRPRWVMIKRTDTAGFDWILQDTSRSTYNSTDSVLNPNSSAAEQNGGGYNLDVLSNGFKVKNSGGQTNASGGTFIYAAFAENPFKNSLAR